MEKYWIFCETTKGKNVWSNGKRFLYSLDERACIFPFSVFFLSQQLQPLLVVVKRPPLHFLGDLSQALLRELARVKLLHTPRACSKYCESAQTLF